MSEKTHAEIVKEMNCGPIPKHRHDREILRYYAYELNAAHKREIDELWKLIGDMAKLREEEIKLTREEERAIDKKLGPDFKKRMTEFAEKLSDLMLEFPMAQGHSRYATYLQQPFYMMSGALHLVKRFGMTENERDEDDEIVSSVPSVLDSIANSVSKLKGSNDGNE